jgi:hypothetical protein
MFQLFPHPSRQRRKYNKGHLNHPINRPLGAPTVDLRPPMDRRPQKIQSERSNRANVFFRGESGT